MKRLPASLSFETLREVWREHRDAHGHNAGSPGVDGVSASEFSTTLAARIHELRSQVQTDRFEFSRLRPAKMPKAGAGYRMIAIPTVRDRLLQRALLRHLEADPRFNGASAISYGFNKGRTLAQAQRRALELRNQRSWVLQADIIKFFDNIPRDEVKRLIRRNVRRKIVAELLCKAVDCEIQERSYGLALAEAGIRRGVGLRQGMPVSPMLSNLLLRDFDAGVMATGAPAVRYADDIAIFAHSRAECLDVLAKIQTLLRPMNLRVQDLSDDGKTLIHEPSQPVQFLGVEIRLFADGYKLCAPDSKLAKIEGDMRAKASLLACVTEQKNLGQVVRALDAFTEGHRAAMTVLNDPQQFIDRLNAAKRRALESLLGELVGQETVKRLNAVSKAVLGISDFPSIKKQPKA